MTAATLDERIAWLRGEAATLRRKAEIAEAAGEPARVVGHLRLGAQWIDDRADAATVPRVAEIVGRRGGVTFSAAVTLFLNNPDLPSDLSFRTVWCCFRSHATASAAEKCGYRRLAAEQVAR